MWILIAALVLLVYMGMMVWICHKEETKLEGMRRGG
jgi:hypothetical protein